MKIVVLDGYALNPGDLSWDGLKALGNLTVYPRTPGEKILERAAGAEIVYTNKTPLDKETINALDSLRFIGVLATGYNLVDTDAAAKKGVTVCNVPAYSADSVAQMTFALLLELCNRVGEHGRAVSAGKWSVCKDFCFWNAPLTELAGKTMGIVGLGQIGQKTAKIAKAFGMKVIAYNRTAKEVPVSGIGRVAPDEVFERADVVSLHLPLSAETKEMIDESALRRMKKTAFFINTSRGGLVDEKALAKALNEEWIAGAGLDVLASEPPAKDNPLLFAKNCVITPHIAWAGKEARGRLMQISADNLTAFLSGKPQNTV